MPNIRGHWHCTSIVVWWAAAAAAECGAALHAGVVGTPPTKPRFVLQESKAASELADRVLSDVQRSTNDMAQLNKWLQVAHHSPCCNMIVA
jgi:hypothetical protein